MGPATSADHLRAVLVRGLLPVLLLAAAPGTAAAQKYPGTTLSPAAPDVMPVVPARPAPRTAPLPPSAAAPAPRTAAPDPAGGAERDAEARQLADRLPLDPATANLRGAMPADVPGTINRLGLRVPNGTATDLRNRPTTREAVIDALRH